MIPKNGCQRACLTDIVRTGKKLAKVSSDGPTTFFLVGYVEERPWWPIQSPNTGRKKKASS